MSDTPEGEVKKAVRKLLDSKKPALYYFMPVQRGFGKRGLDFHCSFYGFGFFIETKAPNEQLTPLQEACKGDMEDSGCPVFVIDNKKPSKCHEFRVLKSWLECIEQRYGRKRART